MARRFAETTNVPIARSRGEIEKLLREWNCDRIQWSDDFRSGVVTLRFVWSRERTPDEAHGLEFVARITVALESEDSIRERCKGRWGDVLAGKVKDANARRGKREHRLLLLWLKAALNAVDAGIVSPEAMFLPFLEGRDGVTVAEAALPRLEKLLVHPAHKLLLGAGT